jgi:hypothetical protein
VTYSVHAEVATDFCCVINCFPSGSTVFTVLLLVSRKLLEISIILGRHELCSKSLSSKTRLLSLGHDLRLRHLGNEAMRKML